jgi:sulfotransferase 6B1
VSVPKAGTHLVERVLCLHPDYHRRVTRTMYVGEPQRLRRHLARIRPGEVICGHLFYEERYREVLHEVAANALFVVRDPRDVLVSNAHYAYDRPDHYRHDVLKRYPSVRDRVALLIEGDRTGTVPPIAAVLERYRGWLDSPALTVRYEDLVNSGTRPAALEGIFRFLGTPLSQRQREELDAKAVSAVSTTFRRGGSGEWREVFDDYLMRAFDDAAGDLTRAYGYSL